MTALSVLVCSVAERQGRTPVLDQLWSQAEGKPVEVLVLTDNERAPTGRLRNALIAAAGGDYVAFVDDRHSAVALDYVDNLLAAARSGADVLTFTIEHRHGGMLVCEVEQSLKHPVGGHSPRPGLVQVSPRHVSAVRREVAARLPFPNAWVGDGDEWAMQLKTAARSEHVIDRVLYIYDDVPRTSIARQYARDYDEAAWRAWADAQ